MIPKDGNFDTMPFSNRLELDLQWWGAVLLFTTRLLNCSNIIYASNIFIPSDRDFPSIQYDIYTFVFLNMDFYDNLSNKYKIIRSFVVYFMKILKISHVSILILYLPRGHTFERKIRCTLNLLDLRMIGTVRRCLISSYIDITLTSVSD